MKKRTQFSQGLKDGIPIGLGYLSVSIGIGIAASAGGLYVITALLMSMTNLTSAGQAAGISIIAAGGSLIELALVQLVINLRYALMGISLTQRLDNSFTTGKRLFLGAFITDEIYAVASSRESVSTKYMLGLAIIPYLGWAIGTLVGASAGMILPTSVTVALGMALYGMFIAIVVPAMKKSRDITLAVCIAAVLSTLFKVLPFLSFISYGFAVILSSVIAAAITAFLSVRRQRA